MNKKTTNKATFHLLHLLLERNRSYHNTKIRSKFIRKVANKVATKSNNNLDLGLGIGIVFLPKTHTQT